MSFGLCNATATFQRTMNLIVSYLRDFWFVYIDDIVIFSRNLSEHVQHLSFVLQRLREQNLLLSVQSAPFPKVKSIMLDSLLGKVAFDTTIESLSNCCLASYKKCQECAKFHWTLRILSTLCSSFSTSSRANNFASSQRSTVALWRSRTKDVHRSSTRSFDSTNVGIPWHFSTFCPEYWCQRCCSWSNVIADRWIRCFTPCCMFQP